MIRKSIHFFKKVLRKLLPGITSHKQSPVVIPNEYQTSLFTQYGQLSKNVGLDRLYVILSFDCDTPKDIPAAKQMYEWLKANEIKGTYCVPGEMLVEGQQVYQTMSKEGARFINHGGAHHTAWRDNAFRSITFYHEMTEESISADIRKGDQIFQQILGKKTQGFRAPHFGNFQSADQRAIIYRALNELGYTFSSSTLPSLAYETGPCSFVNNIYEIPLSGSYQEPYILLDSWNNVISPENPIITEKYTCLLKETVDRLTEMQIPGLLNYYVDPAHVNQVEEFYNLLLYIKDKGVQFLYFEDFIDIIEAKKQCVE